MGKVRKDKPHKRRLKTPGVSSNPTTLVKKQDDIPTSLSAPEVPPLPEDILKSLPVLSLKGTEVKSEKGLSDSDRGRTKKEKRKMRREHWLESTSLDSHFDIDNDLWRGQPLYIARSIELRES